MNTSFTKKLRIVSDFMHLLKRLRYRLLSALVHAGFEASGEAINVAQLSELLQNMNEVVWCNEIFTKMHDKLPLELFKTENIITLLHNRVFAAVAYWFPIVASNIAINQKDVGFEYRDFLLRCAFFFLVYYHECWEKVEHSIPQRKYGNSVDVTFYTKELLIEFTNTLHAHIQLMNTVPNYNFSRNSSMPLEHKFGFARGKSHDVHTLTRFLDVVSATQSISCEETAKMLKSFNAETEKIKGRVYTSITVEEKNEDSLMYTVDCEAGDDLPFSPQNVAKAVLYYAGFYVEKHEEHYGDIMCWLEFFLSEFVGDAPEQRKRRYITLNTFHYGTEQCTRARGRIFSSSIKSPREKHQQNKLSFRREILGDLCSARNLDTTKADMLRLVEEIKKKHRSCPNPPSSKHSKEYIYNWLINNLPSYFAYL